MSQWFEFDRALDREPDADERQAVIDRIAALEHDAIDAIRQIGATVKDTPDVATTASMSLTHIATLAQTEVKAVWKLRDEAKARMR